MCIFKRGGGRCGRLSNLSVWKCNSLYQRFSFGMWRNMKKHQQTAGTAENRHLSPIFYHFWLNQIFYNHFYFLFDCWHNNYEIRIFFDITDWRLLYKYFFLFSNHTKSYLGTFSWRLLNIHGINLAIRP